MYNHQCQVLKTMYRNKGGMVWLAGLGRTSLSGCLATPVPSERANGLVVKYSFAITSM